LPQILCMNGKEYLSFTKKERQGIITLLVILLLVTIVPRYFFPSTPSSTPLSKKDVELLLTQPSANKQFNSHKIYDSVYRPYNRYLNYNKYSKPAYNKSMFQKKTNNKFYNVSQASKKWIRLEINIADTSAFIGLPGIGSKLASRIVLFREKLGGFYDVHQIREVYGITDSVFNIIIPYLYCDSGRIKKIDVNLAAKDDLKVHPYIRWNIANALIAYRENHGAFSSLDDLLRIDNIDSASLKKMMPYLSLH
jgi:DNA uptake protein ComE-like DNA-binding protein